jgi:hypothetical protein
MCGFYRLWRGSAKEHPPQILVHSRQMFEYARHVPLRSHAWSESDVSAAINDIVADGLEYFDGERFWPRHPPGPRNCEEM